MSKTKRIKRLAALVLFVILSVSCLSLTVSGDTRVTYSAETEEKPYVSYTYWEDYGSGKKTRVYCKPMYTVDRVIEPYSKEMQLWGAVTDICTDENDYIYILDGGLSKIYVFDNKYNFVKEIGGLRYGDEEISAKDACGIFVKNEKIYISDSKNGRVLVADTEGKVFKIIGKPESELIPDDFIYQPIRVAVDSKDYTYIACDGSYYGALVFSPQMEFIGFYGANTVKATAGDIIAKLIDRIFSNDAKKEASVLALPYQFSDFAIGPNDFVYTVTGDTDELSGQIKKLNPGGKNVLAKENYNFADDSTDMIRKQSLKGIDVDKDGCFYALDTGNGRIYWYDAVGELLCVFGDYAGEKIQNGTFALATAIAVKGTDVLVADASNNRVTVFSLTQYGKKIRDAQIKILSDNEENTVDEWQEIIRQDSNNQLAYRGLAKAYYMQGEYIDALKYARLGVDRDKYADAFVKIRTNFLEKHFVAFLSAALLLIIALYIICRLLKKKNVRIIKNRKAKIFLSAPFHPFESFRLVKEKGEGSVAIASVMLVLYYISTVLYETCCGFAFNYFDAQSYNSLFALLRTVGLIALFVVSNWLVCVLLGGIGKMKEIYTVTCYSLLPLIISEAAALLLTYILSPDEYIFVTILRTCCLIYSLFMLMVGIIKVQDFEFSKFVGTTVLTFIAMIIIVFLIFLIFLLAQQMVGWISTVGLELKYR